MWTDRSGAEAAQAWFRGSGVGARTASWAWTDSLREQSDSCAPGNPVETMKAKVEPKVPPALACLMLESRTRARARARGLCAQRDWDSGCQDLLRYCVVHAAVGARSFFNPLRARAASPSTHEVKSKPLRCAGWRGAGGRGGGGW